MSRLKGQRSFSAQLAKFGRKVKGRKRDMLRGIITQVRIQMEETAPLGQPEKWASRAPDFYESGRYRANLSIAVDKLPSRVFMDYDDTDPDFARLRAEAAKARKEVKTNSRIYFAALAPYAGKIENGYAIHNAQSTEGVIGPARDKFKQIVLAALEEAKRNNP